MKRERKIVPCRYSTQTDFDIDPGFADDPDVTWLLRQAQTYGLTTLLAHADDGVIWGQVVKDKLALSGQAFPDVSPPLRSVSLQQLRLFGEQAELFVWKEDQDQWRARLLQDQGDPVDGQWRLDEAQLLWGDHPEGEEGGFTLVADGQQGLRHAVPLPASEIWPDDSEKIRSAPWHPLRLTVRHYLERDDDGMLVIAQSRLVKVRAEQPEEGSND